MGNHNVALMVKSHKGRRLRPILGATMGIYACFFQHFHCFLASSLKVLDSVSNLKPGFNAIPPDLTTDQRIQNRTVISGQSRSLLWLEDRYGAD